MCGRARLPGCGEVFSDPSFLEAERVKSLESIQVSALSIPYGTLGWV
jgi:hypothetical protein